MRKVFLEQPDHIYCVRCKAKGKYTLAKTVDHIIPAEICGDFWNTNNWQPLCNRCNMEKWAEDRAAIQEYKRTHNGREK
jgi:5-methylcytosine-specific restriction endonuclease McrA